MDGGLSVEFELPRIENGRPLLLAGLKEWYNRDTVKDIPAQWQRLNPYLGNIRGKVGHAAYGVVFDRRGGVDGFHYLSGVEVSELFGLAGELSSVIIPALKYAVFPHREHVSKLKDTMSFIWHQWIPASGHIHADGPGDAPDMIGRYGASFEPQTGMGDIEVWIPIKACSSLAPRKVSRVEWLTAPQLFSGYGKRNSREPTML